MKEEERLAESGQSKLHPKFTCFRLPCMMFTSPNCSLNIVFNIKDAGDAFSNGFCRAHSSALKAKQLISTLLQTPPFGPSKARMKVSPEGGLHWFGQFVVDRLLGPDSRYRFLFAADQTGLQTKNPWRRHCHKLPRYSDICPFQTGPFNGISRCLGGRRQRDGWQPHRSNSLRADSVDGVQPRSPESAGIPPCIPANS